MLVCFEGPRGGKLDHGLQAYATMAINSFSKQLGINRLKVNIIVKFHHQLFVDHSKTASGLCESVDKRNFVIDVALYGNWLTTLAHELVHVKQFARGEVNSNLTHWKNKDCSDKDYWDQPWEVEARQLQHKLVIEFEKE